MKMFIVYIFFSMGGLILMKLGAGKIAVEINGGVLQFSLGVKVLLALTMYVVSFLIWTQIVAKSDLTYIVPVSSAVVNILTVIVGVLLFREYVSVQQIIGIIITVVGVVLMNIR